VEASVGLQQRVEIARRWRQANVLILDEPTAVLNPGGDEELFRIVRQLRDGGTSVSHLAQSSGSPGDRRHDHRLRRGAVSASVSQPRPRRISRH